MPKKECPGCAMEADRSADVCPICGYEFPKPDHSLQWVAWLMILLLLLWIIF